MRNSAELNEMAASFNMMSVSLEQAREGLENGDGRNAEPAAGTSSRNDPQNRPAAVVRTTAAGRQMINTEFVSEGAEQQLPAEVHVAFYRIAQEAMNNAIKHSQATQISMTLTNTTAVTRLTIADDGTGFDVIQLSAGMGLYTMKERAVALDMSFDLQSEMGAGTQVIVAWNQEE